MNHNWKKVKDYEDIIYEKMEGIAKITINRPEVRNAFRPETVIEMYDAFSDSREDQKIGVILLTGYGPGKGGKYAFCSGGDQKIRGDQGYVGRDGVPRLNVLDLQKLIRSIPKVVIALVSGYAIGGGHVLHVVCNLTIGQKKAREIWYLCNQYSAVEAEKMGLVNKVVPVDRLEAEGIEWAKRILQHSSMAIRLLKSAFNAELDGQSGIQELAGNATLLYYMSEEAQEGKKAYLEKRKPEFNKFPKLP